VTEEADNAEFLSHSSDFPLDKSFPSFQEYAPRWFNAQVTGSF